MASSSIARACFCEYGDADGKSRADGRGQKIDGKEENSRDSNIGSKQHERHRRKLQGSGKKVRLGMFSMVLRSCILAISLPLAEAVTVMPRNPYVLCIAEAVGTWEPMRDAGKCMMRPGGLVARTEDFQPKLETVNATSWASAVEYLRETDAHVVCLQEHKLVDSKIDAANEQVQAAGWKAVWSPAILTAKGAPSCGVAICVKDGIGVFKTALDTAQPHRMIASTVEFPGLPAILLISAYFRTGSGMVGRNLELLRDGCRHIEKQAIPGFWGADFQVESDVLAQTLMLKQINGVVIESKGVLSCTAGKRHSNIDYFIAFGGADALVEEVYARIGTTIKTHRPVRVVFHKKPQQLRMRTLKQPPRLGKIAVIGPAIQGDYGTTGRSLDLALKLALDGHSYSATRALDAAFGWWCDAAEKELEANTGEPQSVYGARGRAPIFKWAPLISDKKKSVVQISEWIVGERRKMAAVRDHLLNLVNELQCIAEVCPDVGVMVRMHEMVDGILLSLSEEVVAAQTGDKEQDLKHADRAKAISRHMTQALMATTDASRIVGQILYDVVPMSCFRDEITRISQWAEEILSDVRFMEMAVAEEESKQVRASLQGLVRGATKATTKRAFQATQLPATWRPAEVTEPDGATTADPLRVLQAERDRLNTLWNGNQQPAKPSGCGPWGGGQPLRKLTPTDLRSVSAAFPRGTAETYDGFHVSHYRLLSDCALHVLCDVLELCECLCIMPTELQTVEIALIPKPKGGHRPIGIYTSLERLHGKARQPEINEWTLAQARDYFANSKGSGALKALIAICTST